MIRSSWRRIFVLDLTEAPSPLFLTISFKNFGEETRGGFRKAFLYFSSGGQKVNIDFIT